MAISKILHMKEGGGGFQARHLKRSLEYVMNPEKTQNGRLVGAVNCQADAAFRQMMDTKQKFGKTDKRQGYHIILSFKEGETEPDKAFEITQRFVSEYLGSEYEAVFVVHDNTAHVHSHIVFNSVSFTDGKKYRYEKGDWAKYIQPITNRLCEEYGLSIIDVEDGRKEAEYENHRRTDHRHSADFIWSDMIRRDLDACILQTDDFDGFLEMLREKGYEIKQGKYLAIKPPGMSRFRRCKTLGDEYEEERIKERIRQEDLAFYRSQKKEEPVQMEVVRIRRSKRSDLSGLQKKYYARLYRTGQLIKRPYSQAWKYRDDIKKMKKLQEQYLFLAEHDIHTAEELAAAVASLTDKKKEASAAKGRAYREKLRCRELFEMADTMEKLIPAEEAYQNGDVFFEEEHGEWERLLAELRGFGYTYEEVQTLRQAYDKRYSDSCIREKAVYKELKTGKQIFYDICSEADIAEREQDLQKNKIIEQDRKDEQNR